MIHHSSLNRLLSIEIIALALFIAGCGQSQPAAIPQKALPAPVVSMAELFDAAIIDAAVVRPDEVFPLLPIRTDSVLLVTWTRFPGSFSLGKTRLSHETWVTVAPELRVLCRRYDQDMLRLRLQQVLGLPPVAESRSFVEFVAAREDLFRPCADPDPSADHCLDTIPADSQADHTQWIADQMLAAYRLPDGYPWTRLGYTFDWNPSTPDYGTSEYVVRANAEINVKIRLSTEAYCSAHD